MTDTRQFRTQTLAAVTALAAVGLAAGCGSTTGATASGSTSSGASSSSSSSSSSAASGARQSPLSKGLLPASAFGAQANVVSLTLQQLQQQQSNGALGDTSGAQVNPPQCAAALKGSQPDPTKAKDLVAQSATTAPSGGGPAVLTVEEILQGGAAAQAVDQLKSISTACPKVTVTLPQGGGAVLTFSPLDVSAVGGQAAAVTLTTTVSAPGQPGVSVPALVGGVQDGDRVVLLITANAKAPSAATGTATASPPAPDPAAFTALLKLAYITEKKALG